jgi:predicted enzyme related to lactoylglutathione lyase
VQHTPEVAQHLLCLRCNIVATDELQVLVDGRATRNEQQIREAHRVCVMADWLAKLGEQDFLSEHVWDGTRRWDQRGQLHTKPPDFRTETDLYPIYRVPMDMKIELILLPVSDVDRAKQFYVDQVGFHADFDHTVNENLRFVQLTPPGSACSIAIGKGITDKRPGSVGGLLMVVQDVDQAYRALSERGVAVTDVHQEDWGRFTEFSDPDGNSWSLQQLPKRG